MLTTEEMKRIIYKDEGQLIENAAWVDHFYELFLERYHALNIIKSPTHVLKLHKTVLLELVRSFHFDEMHLFKIYSNANVFALLTDKGGGYWSYEFIIIYKEDQDTIISGYNTIEDIKKVFGEKEPILEIPLPVHRKYQED